MTANWGLGLWLCLLAASAAWPQFNSAVQGVVTDSSGGVIAGAKVRMTNLATGVSREATTSAEGIYRALSLGPGAYRVVAEKTGFRPAIATATSSASGSTTSSGPARTGCTATSTAPPPTASAAASVPPAAPPGHPADQRHRLDRLLDQLLPRGLVPDQLPLQGDVFLDPLCALLEAGR